MDTNQQNLKWDVFISHASEDKESLVRPLSAALERSGLRVWLDEQEIRVGHSIRRRIENGLLSSRFGIVVLSPSFFAKEWPQKELDFLFASETDSNNRILPVWHKVSIEEVRKHLPLLADRYATNSSSGLESMVGALLASIREFRPGIELTQDNRVTGQIPNYLPIPIHQRLYDLLIQGDVPRRPFSLREARVLVVDDHSDICLVFKDQLEAYGVQCDVASDGKMAWETLQHTHFDLLITDLEMPRMNGTELIQAIQRDDLQIPVIIMTAHFQPSMLGDIPHIGFHFKPVAFDELKESVSDIVQKEGLYRFSKTQFPDFMPTYRTLFKCRSMIGKFLQRFSSNDLFEMALRHKVKDTIREYTRKVEPGKDGTEITENLHTKLKRLKALMEQIKHGSQRGLQKILKAIVEDVKTERPNVKFKISCISELPTSVNGGVIETLLIFSVLEFVGNALDAMERDGQIKIDVKRKQTRNALFLGVWNNGPRIPPNLVETIFDEGISSKGPGRGMGLHIIQGLVERFDGSVSLIQDDGVLFFVEIPLPSTSQ